MGLGPVLLSRLMPVQRPMTLSRVGLSKVIPNRTHKMLLQSSLMQFNERIVGLLYLREKRKMVCMG